ncbi:hypothetical protein [Pseudomonas solani]|uniref:hypothetical protein n=1 Tax=Pseudomonas solani TaxID=2731552 RepID=UPI003D6A7AEB
MSFGITAVALSAQAAEQDYTIEYLSKRDVDLMVWARKMKDEEWRSFERVFITHEKSPEMEAKKAEALKAFMKEMHPENQ